MTDETNIRSVFGEKLKTVTLIILKSETGDYPWEAVKPEDCPDWLKEVGVADRMMEGYKVQSTLDEDKTWYRAEPMPEAANDTDEIH